MSTLNADIKGMVEERRLHQEAAREYEQPRMIKALMLAFVDARVRGENSLRLSPDYLHKTHFFLSDPRFNGLFPIPEVLRLLASHFPEVGVQEVPSRFLWFRRPSTYTLTLPSETT